MKIKLNMKTKKPKPTPVIPKVALTRQSHYDPSFKRAVILFAEQNSISEAKKRYGISESNIRRWRKSKPEVTEKAPSIRPVKRGRGRPARRVRSVNPAAVNDEDCEKFESSNSLDSMPLQQRITKQTTSTPESQEPVLQSQPLSPTKLKVTRQAKSTPTPKAPTPPPPNEEVCLRWNSHHSNMQFAFPTLLLKEQYVDATLVAEGKTLKCHRIILSACSTYFEEVLSGISPLQHPVVFMKDVPFWILKSLCDFMYAGEVHIFQNKLEELLAVADTLKIKGLAGKPDTHDVKQTIELKKEEDKPKEIKEEKKKEEKKKHQPIAPLIKEEAPVKVSPKPSTSKTHNARKQEKEKKERVSIKKDANLLDPLDLLQPVYVEEVTKGVIEKPVIQPPKVQEKKQVVPKKTVAKKVKKRRLNEDRDESPPPFVQQRKGTRSRPNVKVPKFFQTQFPKKPKEILDVTIVHEPHTVQSSDPFIQVEEIKAEPIDVEDEIIEIEDNVMNFSDDQDVTSSQDTMDEEIIGNYDSPIVNLPTTSTTSRLKQVTTTQFEKISLLPQPLIMNVHTVSEGDVNMEIAKSSMDPLDVAEKANTEEAVASIMISNVQSIIEHDIVDSESKEQPNTGMFKIESVISQSTTDVQNRPTKVKEVEKFESEEQNNEISTNNEAIMENVIEEAPSTTSTVDEFEVKDGNTDESATKPDSEELVKEIDTNTKECVESTKEAEGSVSLESHELEAEIKLDEKQEADIEEKPLKTANLEQDSAETQIEPNVETPNTESEVGIHSDETKTCTGNLVQVPELMEVEQTDKNAEKTVPYIDHTQSITETHSTEVVEEATLESSTEIEADLNPNKEDTIKIEVDITEAGCSQEGETNIAAELMEDNTMEKESNEMEVKDSDINILPQVIKDKPIETGADEAEVENFSNPQEERFEESEIGSTIIDETNKDDTIEEATNVRTVDSNQEEERTVDQTTNIVTVDSNQEEQPTLEEATVVSNQEEEEPTNLTTVDSNQGEEPTVEEATNTTTVDSNQEENVCINELDTQSNIIVDSNRDTTNQEENIFEETATQSDILDEANIAHFNTGEETCEEAETQSNVLVEANIDNSNQDEETCEEADAHSNVLVEANIDDSNLDEQTCEETETQSSTLVETNTDNSNVEGKTSNILVETNQDELEKKSNIADVDSSMQLEGASQQVDAMANIIQEDSEVVESSNVAQYTQESEEVTALEGLLTETKHNPAQADQSNAEQLESTDHFDKPVASPEKTLEMIVNDLNESLNVSLQSSSNLICSSSSKEDDNNKSMDEQLDEFWMEMNESIVSEGSEKMKTSLQGSSQEPFEESVPKTQQDTENFQENITEEIKATENEINTSESVINTKKRCRREELEDEIGSFLLGVHDSFERDSKKKKCDTDIDSPELPTCSSSTVTENSDECISRPDDGNMCDKNAL